MSSCSNQSALYWSFQLNGPPRIRSPHDFAMSCADILAFLTRSGRRSHRNPHRVFIEQSKLRRRHFDLFGLRRLWRVANRRIADDPSRLVQLTAGLGVVGLFGPRTGNSSGVLPGKLSGGAGSPGSRTGGGASGRGFPGGSSGGGSVGLLGVGGCISGGSIGGAAISGTVAIGASISG